MNPIETDRLKKAINRYKLEKKTDNLTDKIEKYWTIRYSNPYYGWIIVTKKDL
ncbi:MAG: hypothetical protein H8E34_06085 [Bacteroidetes bacterium]|nr:hypothetical protein [Bacteroidota bacterium]